MKYLISFAERMLILVIYAIVIAANFEWMNRIWTSYSSFPLWDMLVVAGGLLGVALGMNEIVTNITVTHNFLPAMKKLVIFEVILIAFSAIAAFIGWILGLIFVSAMNEIPFWFVFMMVGFVAGVCMASANVVSD